MKLYIIFLFLLPFVILSKSSIILNIDSKSNVPAEFEESLRLILENNYNYDVINLIQKNDFGLDIEKTDVHCRRKSCYIKLGKKIKSNFLLNIEIKSVNSIYSKKYKFKLVLINLKSGSKEGGKLFFYKERLSNISVLTIFSKKILDSFFLAIDKDKARQELEEFNKLPKSPSKKDVISMVRDVYPQIKKCGKVNKFKGKVKTSFIINSDGSVSNIKFISNLDDNLLECILVNLMKMKTIKFKGDSITIKFPLKLD